MNQSPSIEPMNKKPAPVKSALTSIPKRKTERKRKYTKHYHLPKRDGWLLVTPYIARVWLDKCNTLNRPIKKRHLQKLVHDIQQGAWVPNKVEAIAFDTNQQLLDGQHRLAAIVESNVPLQMWIIVEQPVELRRVLDTGEVRKPHDILHMEGILYSGWVVPTINLLQRLDTEKVWNHHALTVADIRNYLERHPEIKIQVPWVGNSMLYRVYRSIAAPCACYCIMHRTHPKQTVRFFTALRDGVASSADDPVAVLRNYLATIESRSTHPRISMNQKVVATYKAFIAFLKGEKLKRIRVHEGDNLPSLTSKS